MQVDKTLENARSCLCLQCPSYTKGCHLKNESDVVAKMPRIDEFSHFEIMFCAFEKSNCIHENRGCLCTKCPVHQKYALNNEDYCLSTGGIL